MSRLYKEKGEMKMELTESSTDKVVNVERMKVELTKLQTDIAEGHFRGIVLIARAKHYREASQEGIRGDEYLYVSACNAEIIALIRCMPNIVAELRHQIRMETAKHIALKKVEEKR